MKNVTISEKKGESMQNNNNRGNGERKLTPVTRDAISIESISTDMNNSPRISLSHLMKQIRLAKKFLCAITSACDPFISLWQVMKLKALNIF